MMSLKVPSLLLLCLLSSIAKPSETLDLNPPSSLPLLLAKVPSINNNQNNTDLTSALPDVTFSNSENPSRLTSLPYTSVTRLIVAPRETPKEKISSAEDSVEKRNEDTIGFGIRSFTVEISTDEKRSATATTSTVATTTTATKQHNLSSPSTTSPNDESEQVSSAAHAETIVVPAHTLTISEQQHPQTSAPNADTFSTSSSNGDKVVNSNLNIQLNDNNDGYELQNNRASHENENANLIEGSTSDGSSEKEVYRVKIGEITTNDFESAMAFEESKDQREEMKRGYLPLHREQLKVNIDDFFPSKVEDFKVLVVEEKTEKPEVIADVNVKRDSRINTSSAISSSSSSGSSSIEIDLIEDTSSPNSNEGEQIIRSSRVVADEEATKTSNEAIKINVRTKKFDPAMKSNTQGPKRIHDFGMTKFTPERFNKSSNQLISGNPEFSTTKFYNSKELYSDILHKSKAPVQAQSVTRSKAPIESSKLINEKKPSQPSTLLPKPIRAVTSSTTTTTTSTTTTAAAAVAAAKHESPLNVATAHPHTLSRLQEKVNSLDCDLQNLSADMTVWRGNETHELNLPITTPDDCSPGSDCLPLILSWEASAEIQSGDVLIVEIDDKFLVPPKKKNATDDKIIHHNTAAVYQVTRLGHEHCDITEGELLDITPLIVDGRKLVTLYDKDLTEGINLLIVVSELWDQQCVRLRVNVKSDNCGENGECSGKGICFSNTSMEGYECECCTGFAGPHCEEIDACTPSPCTNNGICVDLSQGHEGNSYQCLCPYGYTGKNCETETDPCSPSQCLNGGTCVTNTTHFRCECPQGFTGPLCQHNLNECESSPCVHGICVDQEDGFRCFCQPGFSGDLCNYEYNECDSNPCVNNGQCIDHIGGYSCQCTKGYQGQRCHIKIDFCANNPCDDGYRCVDHGDEYSCVCPGSGDHNVPCDEIPRTLCSTNHCANGGTCWTSDESFYCACRPGFIGKMCEEDFVIDTVVSSSELLSDISDTNVITFDDPHDSSPDDSMELHNVYVAAGILASALIALAFLVTIVHCKLNESYRKFSLNYRQLIPFFSRETKISQDDHSKHWLSGKSSSFFEENHISLKNNRPPPSRNQCTSSNLFNGPLQMNLENDMYFSVDFGDSQQSPLIQ